VVLRNLRGFTPCDWGYPNVSPLTGHSSISLTGEAAEWEFCGINFPDWDAYLVKRLSILALAHSIKTLFSSTYQMPKSYLINPHRIISNLKGQYLDAQIPYS